MTTTPLTGLALVLLAGTLLTGCAAANSNEPECDPAPGLVIIAAVHQNTQAPSVPATLGCTLEATIAAEEPVVVIEVDGTPDKLLAETFEITTANEDARREDIAAATAHVVNTINAATADSDGSDLLTAIQTGADQARALGATGAHLIVLDSGLPDRGALNMTLPGMLAANPTEVADFLESTGSLPDLSGLTIELVSFGYVTAPQEPLTIAAKQTTVTIWTTVLERAGATVTDTPLARTGQGPDTPHTTRTVEVPKDPQPTWSTAEQAEPKTAVYDDTTALGFHPDSTELRDPTTATRELTPLAQWLTADPTRSVHIVGTTASAGTADGRAQLSLARADTIKALLVSLGADPVQITTEGAGYTATPPDRTPTGDLDPAAAALNRTVRISTK